MKPGDWRLERQAKRLGFRRVAGFDEAGRGSLAGPVVAAGVILREDFPCRRLPDSKRLRKEERERWHGQILRFSHAVCHAAAGPEEIDRWNVLEATRVAMRRALRGMAVRPDLLLIDAVCLPPQGFPQVSITRGDEVSISIAAASIIAKVERDRIMETLDRRYPQFGFRTNQGYGTVHHRRVLREEGPCPLHRTTFRPLSDRLRRASAPLPAGTREGY